MRRKRGEAVRTFAEPDRRLLGRLWGVSVGALGDHRLNDRGSAFQVFRHLAARDQHRHDRGLLHGLSDSEHPKP